MVLIKQNSFGVWAEFELLFLFFFLFLYLFLFIITAIHIEDFIILGSYVILEHNLFLCIPISTERYDMSSWEIALIFLTAEVKRGVTMQSSDLLSFTIKCLDIRLMAIFGQATTNKNLRRANRAQNWILYRKTTRCRLQNSPTCILLYTI